MKKKNVLFLTAEAPVESPFFTTEKRPPMGLLFMASLVRKAGHNVFFWDSYARPKNVIESGILQRNKIDVVALYCNTICWRDCTNILSKINHLKVSGKHQCKVIVGGPHVSIATDSVPMDLVDHVVLGEGETLIVKLVEEEVKQKILSGKRIEKLDALPFPAYDLINKDRIYKWDCVFMPGVTPVFPMNTSRGCPYKCTFCSACNIWSNKYTSFSPERIIEDIKTLKEKFKAKGIYFREDNFTCDRKRIDKICNLMIKNKLNIPWACESRVDTLTKPLLQKMKKAGCVGLYIGVESGSEKILISLNKKFGLKRVRDIFRYCRELGIKTAASMLYGVPGETEEDLKATKILLDEIKPTVTWNNVYTGLPGSKLYEEVVLNEDGYYTDDRGIIYLKGHNERVDKYYGNHPLKWSTKVPPAKIKDPLVSVVISAYNVKDYIVPAIQSILRQSYNNLEILIVDDCSTDGTKELIEGFERGDKRIRAFYNPYRCGLTKNLNNLVKTAKGKYIARMDADDISLPNRIEEQIKFLEANPQHALVGCSYYHINEVGNIINWINVLCKNESIRPGLRNQNWFAHGSVTMRRDCLIAVGFYDESYIMAQDYYLWVKMASKFKIANMEVPYYCYRIRPENVSIEHKGEQAIFANRAKEEARRLLA